MCEDFSNNQSLPRGIRNNNPGNIRRLGVNWQGAKGVDPQDFIIFKNACWGTRALATDLTHKVGRGLTTIAAIINEYAPASDKNNVPAYIKAVANSTGIDPEDPVTDYENWLPSIMRAIMDHENDDSYLISDDTITQGISLMGVQVAQLPEDVANYAQDNPGAALVVILGIVGIMVLTPPSQR